MEGSAMISGDLYDDLLYNFQTKIAVSECSSSSSIQDDCVSTESDSEKWWKHSLSGGIAGAVSRTTTAPLDRLKVTLQVQNTKQGLSDCVGCMLREGGWRSLWRGNGINVLKIAPESAIKFAAYEQIKKFIRNGETRPMSLFELFVSGACAGCIAQTSIYPLEVLKTRLALRKTGEYSGIADAARKIYAKEGLRSFFRGYIPNLLGIIPYAGIDLAIYETLKGRYLSDHEAEPQICLLLACGSISSSIGQFCSYPLALIKTRLQATAISTTTTTTAHFNFAEFNWISKQQKPASTMTSVFREILEREGIAGLYRGITPNLVKLLPAASISYVIYEYSSRQL